MNSNLTCLSHWFPILHRAGLPMPATTIIPLSDGDIEDLMRTAMENEGAPPPKGDGFARLVASVKSAADAMGYPAFMRSGYFSGKHDWNLACYLADSSKIAKQIKHIVYFGELMNMMGMPIGCWVVREFLKPAAGDVAFYSKHFSEMPVRREFRCFVSGAEVVCVHPYWPAHALDADIETGVGSESAISEIGEPGEHLAAIKDLASRAGAALGGEWSIDVLSTDRGWFITDCAVASNSFHWEGCDNAERFRTPVRACV